MKLRNKALLICLVGMILLAACSKQEAGDKQKHTDTFIGTFDTIVTVIAYTDTEEDYIEIYNNIRKDFEYYNKLFDIYHSYDGMKNIKDINDMAGKEAVKVDGEIIDILSFGKDMYNLTDGKVNIAFGCVLRVWTDIRQAVESGKTIDWNYYQDKLRLANEHVDIKDLIIDEEAQTVFIKDAEMSIDLGSIGKGYAEELIIDKLRDLAVEDVLINAGGSVNVTDDKEGSDWIVGVQNPDLNSSNPIFMKLRLQDESMVSSGNYQRFFMLDGKRYHHIIDSESLFPKDIYSSVTVIAHNSAISDALSTALFNMDIDAGKKLLGEMQGYEALWIYEDGRIEHTKGFERYMYE